MSDLDKIYSALIAGRDNGEALLTWMTGANAHELVRMRLRDIEDALAACRRLQNDLREGRKHIEIP